MFRDTFAINLLAARVDIFTVSQLLGHSNVKITQQHYLNFIPGYVERMISNSYQPIHVPVQVEGKAEKLTATAARSEDGKALVLRVVNAGDKAVAANLVLAGFKASKPTASVEELAGALDAVNTAAEPRRIATVAREWRHEKDRTYTFPPGSFTVIKVE